MSNAQRRREHRHRSKSRPGPMTPQRVEAHRLTQMRLADLERLRKIVVAKLAEEERERESVSEVEEWEQETLPGLEPEPEPEDGPDMEAVTGFVDELRDFLTVPGEPEEPQEEPEEPQEEPEVHGCPCGHPDAADGSLEHVLVHNRDEVSGAVTLDWSAADPGNGCPMPYLFRVVLADGTGVRLHPARITVMADSAASLAVVDVTELINADGEPIRSNTAAKMGVHTEEYKAWAYDGQRGGDDVFLGDKYQTVVNRFVLVSSPVAP